MSGQRTAPVHDPVLKTSPLLKNLSDLEYNAVLAFLEPRRVRSGDTIMKEGADGEEMFILVSGRISAWVSQADGTQRMMFEISPGDFFGEMSIIANESRSATLKAKVDTELLVLHGIDFFRIIYDHPIIGSKMLDAIRKVQNIWLEQTSRYLSDLMRWGETARRRAIVDELTGLYNRRFLEESAQVRFSQGNVGLRSVSLMMMDLDKIHEINERHGTSAGDQMFISVADVLRTATRNWDICARLSGDEFAVLLPDTGSEEARVIAERVRQITSEKKVSVPKTPDSAEKTEIAVSTSIGIATAPIHADTWASLLLAADKALHHSKEMGRNRVEIAVQ
jgi:diguanylate cyclase (GGDEF)-like protein